MTRDPWPELIRMVLEPAHTLEERLRRTDLLIRALPETSPRALDLQQFRESLSIATLAQRELFSDEAHPTPRR